MRALITSMGTGDKASAACITSAALVAVVEDRPGRSFRLDIQVAWFSIERTTPINAVKKSFAETNDSI